MLLHTLFFFYLNPVEFGAIFGAVFWGRFDQSATAVGAVLTNLGPFRLGAVLTWGRFDLIPLTLTNLVTVMSFRWRIITDCTVSYWTLTHAGFLLHLQVILD